MLISMSRTLDRRSELLLKSRAWDPSDASCSKNINIVISFYRQGLHGSGDYGKVLRVSSIVT